MAVAAGDMTQHVFACFHDKMESALKSNQAPRALAMWLEMSQSHWMAGERQQMYVQRTGHKVVALVAEQLPAFVQLMAQQPAMIAAVKGDQLKAE